MAEVNTTVDNLTTLMWIAVPLLVLLVAFAVWYFAGHALRPVELIRLQAASISGSTIHRRVPEPGTDDEVGRLAHTMNAMLDRLEQSSQRQRQFVSDASHELRSPLASIRANLEVALRNSDRADWPAVARRALAEDQRMEDTVSELLELARLDESRGDEPLTSLPEIDLEELVLDETLQPHAVSVDATRVSAGRVHGRRDQLARLVRNLVDNASRHARARVDLSLQSSDGTVTLMVDDDGPGIAPDDRERVFERFTRLDDGRARDAGGLGIGLAIVKAVAEQHGGTVTVDDAPIGGARFVVTCPLSRPRCPGHAVQATPCTTHAAREALVSTGAAAHDRQLQRARGAAAPPRRPLRTVRPRRGAARLRRRRRDRAPGVVHPRRRARRQCRRSPPSSARNCTSSRSGG